MEGITYNRCDGLGLATIHGRADCRLGNDTMTAILHTRTYAWFFDCMYSR